jgi:hypothetical protein
MADKISQIRIKKQDIIADIVDDALAELTVLLMDADKSKLPDVENMTPHKKECLFDIRNKLIKKIKNQSTNKLKEVESLVETLVFEDEHRGKLKLVNYEGLLDGLKRLELGQEDGGEE